MMVTGTREEIRIGQLAIRFLVEGRASGGSVAVFEFDVPAGAKVPVAHSHDAYEETIYGLEGVLTLTVDGRQSDVGPGEVLCDTSRSGPPLRQLSLRPTRRCSRSSPPASSGQTTSAKWRRTQGRSWRPARPRSDGRSDATPRPHPGAVTSYRTRFCDKVER